MDDYKEIENSIINYGAKLEPSESQVKLMYKNIMKNSDSTSPSRLQLFKSKWLLIGTPMLLMFLVALPLILNNTKLDSNQLAILPESPQIAKNFGKSSEGANLDSYSYGEQTTTSMRSDQNVPEDTKTLQEDRAQIKQATMNIQVENFDQKYKLIIDKSADLGGYIVSSQINKNSMSDIYVETSIKEDSKYGYIEVRIPAEQFDQFVSFIRSTAKVISYESININDSQNKLTQINREVKDIEKQIAELDAKQKLTQEQEYELESLQKQLEYTKDNKRDVETQANFSTVVIELSNYSPESTIYGDIWQQTVNSIREVVIFWVQAFSWLLVPVVFILPIIVIVIVGWKLYKRKKK